MDDGGQMIKWWWLDDWVIGGLMIGWWMDDQMMVAG